MKFYLFHPHSLIFDFYRQFLTLIPDLFFFFSLLILSLLSFLSLFLSSFGALAPHTLPETKLTLLLSPIFAAFPYLCCFPPSLQLSPIFFHIYLFFFIYLRRRLRFWKCVRRRCAEEIRERERKKSGAKPIGLTPDKYRNVLTSARSKGISGYAWMIWRKPAYGGQRML